MDMNVICVPNTIHLKAPMRLSYSQSFILLTIADQFSKNQSPPLSTRLNVPRNHTIPLGWFDKIYSAQIKFAIGPPRLWAVRRSPFRLGDVVFTIVLAAIDPGLGWLCGVYITLLDEAFWRECLLLKQLQPRISRVLKHESTHSPRELSKAMCGCHY
jgi:hypothetical protein